MYKNINYKKILLICLVFISLFVVGCNKNTSKKPIKKEQVIKKEKYVDANNMKIGIYENNNGKLNLLDSFSNIFVRGTDIAVFQLFPSNDKEIVCNNKFAEMFYERISATNNKIGFNITYTLKDNSKTSHNILKPSDTMLHAEYLEIYLYDDYYHRNDNWYSHIEEKDYNDNTLYTSIKLTPGMKIDDITSNIKLTVFTYDSEDDFDSNTNEYRGNSKYSIEISRKD
ncbi:MAG: hypothetical protein IJF92_05005 [Bacilli bacterium]|nr:hypothetical protein [Bacilli bacterium]